MDIGFDVKPKGTYIVFVQFDMVCLLSGLVVLCTCLFVCLFVCLAIRCEPVLPVFVSLLIRLLS